jgi:hypothetical protein
MPYSGEVCSVSRVSYPTLDTCLPPEAEEPTIYRMDQYSNFASKIPVGRINWVEGWGRGSEVLVNDLVDAPNVIGAILDYKRDIRR